LQRFEHQQSLQLFGYYERWDAGVLNHVQKRGTFGWVACITVPVVSVPLADKSDVQVAVFAFINVYLTHARDAPRERRNPPYAFQRVLDRSLCRPLRLKVGQKVGYFGYLLLNHGEYDLVRSRFVLVPCWPPHQLLPLLFQRVPGRDHRIYIDALLILFVLPDGALDFVRHVKEPPLLFNVCGWAITVLSGSGHFIGLARLCIKLAQTPRPCHIVSVMCIDRFGSKKISECVILLRAIFVWDTETTHVLFVCISQNNT
jgi:hypothetical protein